jgi:hypothetical protein
LIGSLLGLASSLVCCSPSSSITERGEDSLVGVEVIVPVTDSLRREVPLEPLLVVSAPKSSCWTPDEWIRAYRPTEARPLVIVVVGQETLDRLTSRPRHRGVHIVDDTEGRWLPREVHDRAPVALVVSRTGVVTEARQGEPAVRLILQSFATVNHQEGHGERL